MVGGEGAEVDGRLGVGGEDDKRVAVAEAGQRGARPDQRERAGEAAGVDEVLHTVPSMMAVILESGEPARIYTGLSLLVSAAAEGEPARGLVSFGALGPLLAERMTDGDGVFDRTLHELRETAAELPDCRLWACAAAAETTGLRPHGPLIEGVLSTPRFLADTAGARLVVV